MAKSVAARTACVACAVMFAPLSTASFAATLAADTASDPAYNRAADTPAGNSWVTGDNGGAGFGAWTLTTSAGAFSLGASATNGDGGAGTPPATDIDTPHVAVADTRSWRVTSNDGLAEAFRGFTGGSLGVGQVFNLGLDTGVIDTNPAFADGDGVGSAGFSLRSGGTTRFEFLNTAGNGSNTYTINALTGGGNTVHVFSDEGMTTAFTLTGTDGYSFAVTFLDTGVTETFSGTLLGSGGLDNVRLFANNTLPGLGAAAQPAADVYYNSISIVPEPSVLAVLLAGCARPLRRRRRV